MMLGGYTVGQLSSLISNDGEGKKKKNKKDSKSAALFENSPIIVKKKDKLTAVLDTSIDRKQKEHLAADVSDKASKSVLRHGKTVIPEPDNGQSQTNKETKPVKKKRKEENVEKKAEDVTKKVHDNPLHESLQTDKVSTKKGKAQKRKLEDDELQIIKKRRKKYKPDKQREWKTIFIGNLPATINKRALEKMFKEYGDIESIRLRSAASKDPKVSKKMAVIKKEFHPNKKNINAYIVYKETFQAQKALQCNGKEVEGYHIRVDLSGAAKEHDNRRSLFLGNLPFDITENEVWGHFEDCGAMENVRLIRDGKTGIGKGFGYILFKSSDSVSLALRMKNNQLKGREVRVKRCMNQEKVLSIGSKMRKGSNSATKLQLQNKNNSMKNSHREKKEFDVKDKLAKVKQVKKKKKQHFQDKQKKVVADFLLGNKAYKDKKPRQSSDGKKRKMYGKGYHNVMSAQKRLMKRAKKQPK